MCSMAMHKASINVRLQIYLSIPRCTPHYSTVIKSNGPIEYLRHLFMNILSVNELQSCRMHPQKKKHFYCYTQ